MHLAVALVEAHVERPAADVITQIPPDDGRQLRRGHHPAAALAAGLAERWQLEHAPLLARTRPVRPQRGLGLAERRRNVRGAFVAEGPVAPTVVLVDDVYTTGSTASEAAAALRAAGAETVHVVTFSRAVR